MPTAGRMVMAQVAVVGFFAFFSVATFYKVYNFPATENQKKGARMCDYQDTVYCNGVGTVVCTDCESGENPVHCYRRHLAAIEAVLANCNLRAKLFASYGYVEGKGPDPNVKPTGGLLITEDVIKNGIEALEHK